MDNEKLFWLESSVPRTAQEVELMLILSRKVGERIRIADHIELVVTAIEGGRIRIGVEAPKTVQVLRAELASHLPAECERAV